MKNSKGHKALLLALVIPVLFSCAAIGQTILNPSDDATISGAQPEKNHGFNGSLTPWNRGIPSRSYKAWLRFDASKMRSIQSVDDLEAVATGDSEATRQGARFYLITGLDADYWDQGTITWDNAPGNDVESATGFDDENYMVMFLGSTPSASSLGETVHIKWEPGARATLLKELRSGDRVATIAVSRESANGYARYGSREAREGSIRLVLSN